MAKLRIDAQVGGHREMGALAQRLRATAASGRLQRDARQNLRAAARPVLRDLRAAVRSVEVSSSKGGHVPPDRSNNLRNRIARALEARPTVSGVRFSVAPARVDPRYGRSLPRYMDAELPRYRNWRHPVFGKPPWQVQHGRPWFFVTIRAHAASFRRGVERAIDRTLETLTKG